MHFPGLLCHCRIMDHGTRYETCVTLLLDPHFLLIYILQVRQSASGSKLLSEYRLHLSILGRNVSKGRVTALLLNLCGSLICLNLVLYVAEMISNSRIGCAISNILRYYFIMASLLWNGAEAYNMYLMLIKVFDTGVTYFMVKSAIISWGELSDYTSSFSLILILLNL